MARKASDTYAWQQRNLARMSTADMERFAATYPAFRAALADNVMRERNAWVAQGATAADADKAAVALWERGIRAGRLEIAAEATRRFFSPADIGWVTRRRNADRAAKAAKGRTA